MAKLAATGYFHASKQLKQTLLPPLRQMEIFRAQHNGHLVTISSASAVRGFRPAMTVYVVYVANKIAITSLSEGIRIDIAAPVKVSCIHPALFAVKLTIR